MNNDELEQREENEIVPSIETKLNKDKRNECKNIVREVMNFGVNQRQLLYLIYLLSLNLEEREAMLAIVRAVNENREKIHVSSIHIPTDMP